MSSAYNYFKTAKEKLENAKAGYEAAKKSFSNTLIRPEDAAAAYIKRIDAELKEIETAIDEIDKAMNIMSKNDMGWNDE